LDSSRVQLLKLESEEVVDQPKGLFSVGVDTKVKTVRIADDREPLEVKGTRIQDSYSLVKLGKDEAEVLM
jgi:hypothetical protein